MSIKLSVFVLVLLNYFGNNIEALTGPKHGKIVVCYMGTWSVYRPERGSFTIEHLDPTLCTHIVYAFAGLDAQEGIIKSLDEWQDLKDNYGKDGYARMTGLKERYPHLKVTLALGGWNEGSTNYSNLVKHPDRRSKFIASALQFIKKYNFDGLDLDWEFPGKRGGVPEDKLNFLLFVKELKAAFKKHNLLLTAAFGAGKDTIDVAYDVEGLSVYLDFIHMMCYDYHGAWDQKTGANAPLRSSDILSVEYSINYMMKLGAPAKKLVLGIPLYGRTFLLAEPVAEPITKKPKLGAVARNIGFQGPFTRENGFMGYNEICLELQNSTWNQFWDGDTQTPYAVSGNKVITFDDENSIAKKIHFAMEKELGGVMVWSIDTDDFQGDCSNTGSEQEMGTVENYPLMRAINRGIEKSLEEIERDKENAIIHGNAEHVSHGSIVDFSLIFFVGITVVNCFYSVIF